MKHYSYMDENFRLPRRSFAWFFYVHCRRQLREMERLHPEKLAVKFAEVHTGVLRW